MHVEHDDPEQAFVQEAWNPSGHVLVVGWHDVFVCVYVHKPAWHAPVDEYVVSVLPKQELAGG